MTDVISRLRTLVRRWSPIWRLIRDERGASMTEYLIITGFASFIAISAFYRFGRELNDNLDAEAEHIQGRGMPNASDLLDDLTDLDSLTPCTPMPTCLVDTPSTPGFGSPDSGAPGGTTPVVGTPPNPGTPGAGPPGAEPPGATPDAPPEGVPGAGDPDPGGLGSEPPAPDASPPDPVPPTDPDEPFADK